ncbi:MAG: type II secretion system protein [Ilumatobacteraceae bacterium]
MAHRSKWRGASRCRDRGTTFVEVLVAIVLLGTVVGGTLTALRTTIVSSERGAGMATASAWLREAEATLHTDPFYPCTTPTDVTNHYLAVLEGAPRPAEWGVGGTINITSVQFWGRDASKQEGWQPACTPGSVAAQLIEFYVLSPSGDVGQRIQVVKGG